MKEDLITKYDKIGDIKNSYNAKKKKLINEIEEMNNAK